MGGVETAAVAALKCGHPIVSRETLFAYKVFQNWLLLVELMTRRFGAVYGQHSTVQYRIPCVDAETRQ